MRPERKLRTLEFLKDFRAGLTDSEIMERHKLSAQQLKKVYKTMVERGYLKPEEFGFRPIGIDDTVMIDMSKLKRD